MEFFFTCSFHILYYYFIYIWENPAYYETFTSQFHIKSKNLKKHNLNISFIIVFSFSFTHLQQLDINKSILSEEEQQLRKIKVRATYAKKIVIYAQKVLMSPKHKIKNYTSHTQVKIYSHNKPQKYVYLNYPLHPVSLPTTLKGICCKSKEEKRQVNILETILNENKSKVS